MRVRAKFTVGLAIQTRFTIQVIIGGITIGVTGMTASGGGSQTEPRFPYKIALSYLVLCVMPGPLTPLFMEELYTQPPFGVSAAVGHATSPDVQHAPRPARPLRERTASTAGL